MECKEHNCTDVCHEGECSPCILQPEYQKYCVCGKTLIEDIANFKKRLSCRDPIPCCEKKCDKILPCGNPGGYFFFDI